MCGISVSIGAALVGDGAVPPLQERLHVALQGTALVAHGLGQLQIQTDVLMPRPSHRPQVSLP